MDNWATPKDLYNKLDAEFNFNFDPCPLNSRFDGLLMDWKERNFINPPYSRKLKELFINKAYKEATTGLKVNEEMTFTDDEIDSLLPKNLRKNKVKRDAL